MTFDGLQSGVQQDGGALQDAREPDGAWTGVLHTFPRGQQLAPWHHH